MTQLAELLKAALLSKSPREIKPEVPQNHPVRVIHAIESQAKQLDEQQQKIAAEAPDSVQRLRGLAGTGKTILFAKRAAQIHAAHPQWRLAFVFFTRSLYEQIRDLISLYYQELAGQEPNWTQLKVLHAWGAKEQEGFYRTLALACQVKPQSVSDVVKEIGQVSPGQAFEHICAGLEREAVNLPTLYDAVLIDEGQDLPAAFYRLAYQALSEPKRLYWAYDEAQSIGSLMIPKSETIFGKHADGSLVVDVSGNKTYKLNRCYRTPRLLLMTAHALNMGLLRTEGPLQGVTNKRDWEDLGYEVLEGDFRKLGQSVTVTRPDDKSPHPVDQANFEWREAVGLPLTVKAFGGEAQERKWIAEQIAHDLARGLDPLDLLVTALCGDSEEQYFLELQKLLKAYGVQSCIAGLDTDRDTFGLPGHVTLANIYRAKGNEAWKVYACRFHYTSRPLAWKAEEELHKRNEAFVALTRARIWCVATGLADPIFDEIQRIQDQYPNLTFPAFNQASLRRSFDEQASDPS